jgi:alpha-mannosidase
MTPSAPVQSLYPLIPRTITHLRGLSQQDVLGLWHRCPEDTPNPSFPLRETDWQSWPQSCLNDRHHIAWRRGKVPLWLHQRFTWPNALNGYSLEGYSAKLALRWWADQAELYINGKLAHTGDIFDCWTRLDLADHVVPGQAVDVTFKLLSPGHDDGALVYSTLIFESNDLDKPEPGFVADELAVLEIYAAKFAPEHLPLISTAVEQLDWQSLPDRDAFQASLAKVRETLLPLSPWLKKRTIHCLGHAHLDLAWLWPIDETWEAAERTFQSVLQLQQEFPELTFSHSSPALFAWIEQHRPELFKAIQQQVKAGRWAIDAGLWVEPDLNLPGGEAIARQILYGQRYCEEQFGETSKIAWLPDTFGFSWQLPQLLTQGGIRYFATQKLRWNDTNPFPHDLFTWHGLDGTPITAVTLPPIGTDIDPVEMANYAANWEANTGYPQSLWLPGVGDHGGGPTRDMLTKAKRWSHSPFFPTLTFTHVTPLLDHLTQPHHPPTSPTPPTSLTSPIHPSTHPPIHPPTPLPEWKDELYLELHRACYTTHADQKQYNRRCEDILFQAELFASLATIQELIPYPKTELETAWKQVLFNQFHDILPGSSIPEVFTEANQNWQAALISAKQILQQSLQAITAQVDIPQPPAGVAIPVVLFNCLNWHRSEVVSIPIPESYTSILVWEAQTADGETLKTQVLQTANQAKPPSLLVSVPNLPSVGYRLIWLIPTDHDAAPFPKPDHWIMENQILKVSIDPTTGNITNLIHKPSGTETFSSPGNELQAFEDRGQYWDAWNIDPKYQDNPLNDFQLQSIAWLEQGPVRQTIRIIKTFNQSTFIQDYTLNDQSPVLDIHTEADWHETHVLVKAAFPFIISVPYATYEIPYGAIQRSTVPQNSYEAAKWEVPALRWADLSQTNFGVSILTDYKHGFSAAPNQLQITLLKAPLWPDPQADRGQHSFRYSIYPHSSGWEAAHTVHRAYNANFPIYPCFLHADETSADATLFKSLPSTMSFLNLGDNALVISTLKCAEDTTHQFILRCYESTGSKSALIFSSPLSLELSEAVDILETPIPRRHGSPDHCDNPDNLKTEISPWQIASYALVKKHSED